MGYFSRKGSPGSSYKLGSNGLRAGVTKGGGTVTAPGQGNLGDGSLRPTPTVPSGNCSPARELRSRTRAARREGGPGSRREGRRDGSEHLLPAAAPDAQSVGRSAPPASSAPRLTSSWRPASAEAAPPPPRPAALSAV